MLVKGFFILILVISGCSKSQRTENHLQDSFPDTTQLQEDKRPSSSKEKSIVAGSDNYSSKFLYKDSASNVNQVLFVNWLSKDTIKFRLVSDNDLCNNEHTGIAVNDYPDWIMN